MNKTLALVAALSLVSSVAFAAEHETKAEAPAAKTEATKEAAKPAEKVVKTEAAATATTEKK